MSSMILQMIASLVAVLFIMIGISAIVRKYIGVSGSSTNSAINVEVLSQKTIQPKRSILVLKIWNKIYVVGSTEHGFTAIGEIDNQELLTVLQPSLEKESPSQKIIFGNSKNDAIQLPNLKSVLGFSRHSKTKT